MNQKITAEDMRLICALKKERDKLYEQARSLSNKEIGKKFGLHESTIRKAYKRVHVNG